MSTTLLFLVPIGMLAVAWPMCFVGCALQSGGLGETEPPPPEPVPYNTIILGDPDLIAYWTLNDAPSVDPVGTPITTGPFVNSIILGTAFDATANMGNPNPHPGQYIKPPAYPLLGGSSMFSGPPSIVSAGSIVAGDIFNTIFPDTKATSALFGGGYVAVPWYGPHAPDLNQFTLEAWIVPQDWPSGTAVTYVVFGALHQDSAGNVTGFVVALDNTADPTQAPFLQVIVGNGTPNAPPPFYLTSTPIDPGATTYLAVSGDATTGTLNLVAGVGEGMLANASFTQSGYVAINGADPNLQMTFYIGAGQNDKPPRTQDGGMGSPEYPFLGKMQSVALYKSASINVQQHYESGNAL